MVLFWKELQNRYGGCRLEFMFSTWTGKKRENLEKWESIFQSSSGESREILSTYNFSVICFSWTLLFVFVK